MIHLIILLAASFTFGAIVGYKHGKNVSKWTDNHEY
jgi:hypothetical protein